MWFWVAAALQVAPPANKPAPDEEVQHVGGKQGEASEARPITPQQWAVALGLLVAAGTLYAFLVSPVRDQARTEAEVRARLALHDGQIAELQRQAAEDRKSGSERYDELRKKLDESGRGTDALRLEVRGISGRIDVLMERMQRR